MDRTNPIDTFNQIADTYSEEFNEPSQYTATLIRMLPKDSRVLDLGCGPGVETEHLVTNGFNVHTVDGAINMIQLAKERTPSATFETADIRELDYGQEQYDGIIALYSLTYIPKLDIPKLFSKLVKSLKPSGLFLISLHIGSSQELELDEPLDPNLRIFLNIFSKEELHQMVSDNQLTTLEEYERPSKSKEELGFTKYSVLLRKDF